MGWFSYKDTEQIIGDDVLDLAHEFLHNVSMKYSEGLSRNVTLSEIQTLLELSLAYMDEESIGGLSEKTVSGVTIRTTKRKKKQKISVGDVFAAPVATGGFVYGRVVYIVGSDPFVICEIFSHHTETVCYSSSVCKASRLLSPFVSLTNIFESWEWKVVGHCMEGIEKDISSLKFVIGGEDNYYLVPGDKVDQFYKENPISNEEAEKYTHVGFKACKRHAKDFAQALENIK